MKVVDGGGRRSVYSGWSIFCSDSLLVAAASRYSTVQAKNRQGFAARRTAAPNRDVTGVPERWARWVGGVAAGFQAKAV